MSRKSKLFCLGTFHPEVEIRLIEGLLDAQICGSCDVSHFAEQRICIAPVSLQIMSHNLNVDGSRQPKIQNLADHVSGQESERNTRELPRECQAQLVNVVVGGTVISGQSHQNVGVRCANRSRVAVREINATVWQAYVVNDVVDFACRNLPPNRLFDPITQVGRFFNAHSGGTTHVKFESTAVHAGEEVPAQPGDQNCQRAETHREECDQENTPVMETGFQQAAIAPTKSLEGLLKSLLNSY